jgi:hypothetical protein
MRSGVEGVFAANAEMVGLLLDNLAFVGVAAEFEVRRRGVGNRIIHIEFLPLMQVHLAFLTNRAVRLGFAADRQAAERKTHTPQNDQDDNDARQSADRARQ